MLRYTIQSGDTFRGIASKYGVSEDALYIANAGMLADMWRHHSVHNPNRRPIDQIYPGWTLRIPVERNVDADLKDKALCIKEQAQTEMHVLGMNVIDQGVTLEGIQEQAAIIQKKVMHLLEIAIKIRTH